MHYGVKLLYSKLHFTLYDLIPNYRNTLRLFNLQNLNSSEKDELNNI